MKSITRIGDIGRIFQGGASPCLNAIARLSVLYEDFRIEHTALAELAAQEDGEINRYRFIYLIRRSVATMSEFQGGLTQLLGTPEFKNARLSKLDRESIDDANKYLQKACSRIAQWRNAIGGHFQSSAAVAACKAVPVGTPGKITWNRATEHPLHLELHFAELLVAGAISSLMDASGDPQIELGKALDELMDGYVQIQKAMYAITHHFLWPKCGR